MSDLTHSKIRADNERRSEHDQRVLLNEILVELKAIRFLLMEVPERTNSTGGNADAPAI